MGDAPSSAAGPAHVPAELTSVQQRVAATARRGLAGAVAALVGEDLEAVAAGLAGWARRGAGPLAAAELPLWRAVAAVGATPPDDAATSTLRAFLAGRPVEQAAVRRACATAASMPADAVAVGAGASADRAEESADAVAAGAGASADRAEESPGAVAALPAEQAALVAELWTRSLLEAVAAYFERLTVLLAELRGEVNADSAPADIKRRLAGDERLAAEAARAERLAGCIAARLGAPGGAADGERPAALALPPPSPAAPAASTTPAGARAGEGADAAGPPTAPFLPVGGPPSGVGAPVGDEAGFEADALSAFLETPAAPARRRASTVVAAVFVLGASGLAVGLLLAVLAGWSPFGGGLPW